MKSVTEGVLNFLPVTLKNNDKISQKPKFICNNPAQGQSVISALEKLLQNCTGFSFAVAFITKSGLLLLKDALHMLERRGIKGRILTSDYLNFTDPAALEEIRKFPNIDLRVCEKAFHAKTYIFSQYRSMSFLLGSANITQEALKANEEWNVQFCCTRKDAAAAEISNRFNALWQNAAVVTKDWLKKYNDRYTLLHTLRLKITAAEKPSALRANVMQKRVLAALKKLRSQGKKKALLISATGTGKTYISAFDISQLSPHKVLFIAHREQILHQAEKSYKKVLGSIKTGFLAGNKKDFSADFLFATINMLAKDDVLQHFSPIEFDYIVIDETHRAGAVSYQHVFSYFQPAFMLGMTATPERTDAFDIYSLFGHNVAYEIRLQEAMRENLLCPFHYFGIAELTIDDKIIDEHSVFNKLVCEERVSRIIDKASFYGYSGSRVHGLIFCRSIKEAQALSNTFNARGFSTAALCGSDSQAKRDIAVRRLSQKDRAGGLDYIFSVDIMNEGIDIPAVNQIILLRPTQSPIIFVQQLGRGLRKKEDKDYVVVLDFIGNYNNNFMIPIALFGDNSCNKDNLRRCVSDGKNILYGASTVSFDEIARKNIYRAIDTVRFSDTAFLRKAYSDLKNKLGAIPSLSDFNAFGTVDILRYADKFGSYHAFLTKYEKDYDEKLTNEQEEILGFIYKRFAAGKRIYEIMLLQMLIEKRSLFSCFEKKLRRMYDITLTPEEKTSVINNLTNIFTISNERKKYRYCVFLQKHGSDYTISDTFADALSSAVFKNKMTALLNFAAARHKKYYSSTYKAASLCLYQKYTYEEVCWLLNWPQKINPNAMAGYFYESTTRTMPVFINYISSERKRVAYVNKFSDNAHINAFSKLRRRIDSTDAQHIYSKTEGSRLYLFVRKPYEQKESKEFYFLGEIKATGTPKPAPQFDGFEVNYELATPVRSDIFDYLTS